MLLFLFFPLPAGEQMMLYTQHIGSGTGKVTHAFEFKLVDTGKFEYVRMYALSPEYELMKDANFE